MPAPKAVAPETQSASSPAEPESATVFANGAKLIGESFVPGASLLLDGAVPTGLAHTAAGFGARAMLGAFGPIGVVLVAANSYSKSVTDRHLFEHLTGVAQSARGQRPPSGSAAS